MELRYSINSSAHWTADSWICWRVWLKIIQHISSWFLWYWRNYPSISPAYLLDRWNPKYPSYPHRWTLAENGPRCLPTPHLLCHLLEAPSGTTLSHNGVPRNGPLVIDCPWHPYGLAKKSIHVLGVDRCWSYWPQPIQHPSTHRTNPVGRRGFTLRFQGRRGDQNPRVSMLKPPTVRLVFWVRILTRNEKMDCLRPNKDDQFGSEWHVAPSQLMFWVWGACGLRQYTYKHVWQRTNDCWKWYWNQQTWK